MVARGGADFHESEPPAISMSKHICYPGRLTLTVTQEYQPSVRNLYHAASNRCHLFLTYAVLYAAIYVGESCSSVTEE